MGSGPEVNRNAHPRLRPDYPASPLRVAVGELRLGPREKDYLQRVIDSNRLSYGPFSQKLEALFAQLHDCKYAVFCNSGTSALHIAVAALKELHGWRDG